MRVALSLVLVLAAVAAGCVPGEEAPTAPETSSEAPVLTPPPQVVPEVSVEAPPEGAEAPAEAEPAATPTIPQVGTSAAPSVVSALGSSAEAHPDAPVHDSSRDAEGQVATLAGPSAEDVPKSDLSVKVTPMEGAEGFTVEGAFDMTGTITRPDPAAEQWVLKASMAFPNDGYTTGEPFLQAAQTRMPPKTPEEEGELVDVVIIGLPIGIPGADAEVKEGAVEVPLELTIPAPAGVRFAIAFSVM